MTAIEQKQSQFQTISIPYKRFVQHSISGHWKNSVLSVRSSSPAEYILLCQMAFWGPWWWFSSTLRMAWLEAAVGAPWESRLWWEDDFPIPWGIVASCSVGRKIGCRLWFFTFWGTRYSFAGSAFCPSQYNWEYQMIYKWTFPRVYMDIQR